MGHYRPTGIMMSNASRAIPAARQLEWTASVRQATLCYSANSTRTNVNQVMAGWATLMPYPSALPTRL